MLFSITFFFKSLGPQQYMTSGILDRSANFSNYTLSFYEGFHCDQSIPLNILLPPGTPPPLSRLLNLVQLETLITFMFTGNWNYTLVTVH